ncbi:MAG: hypothetical protein HYX84_03995 [Chloroflexi bacterium]|nr:hypothetical protein [Chloroflexota bacterium]
MNYEEFIEGINWTKQEWARMDRNRNLSEEFHYENLRKRGDEYWLHLERMTEDELAKETIDRFLNTPEWSCHLDKPSSPNGNEIVRNLKRAIDQLRQLYATLDGLNIVDIDILSNFVVIGGIYTTFCDIKPRFGPVPTSKLMHMALPNLFVMWDNAIISGYRVPAYPSDKPQYLPFLVLMQENARHIWNTRQAHSHEDLRDFVTRINKECGYEGLSLPRLLDIANYAVGHQDRKAPCEICCKKTNTRLQEIETTVSQHLGPDFKLGRFRW